ncbi:MAG: DUF2905 domain-containing protein [Chlorobiaceae bacterium]
MLSDAGKLVVIAGVVTVLVGLLMMASGRTGISGWFSWFSNLPLDIKIERENFRFYFPLGSSLLLSLIISLVLYIINKVIR